MVSYQLAKDALSRLLRKELQSFHQVLYFDDPGDPDPPLVYFAMAKDEVLLVDVQTAEDMMNGDAMDGDTYEPMDVIRFKYSDIVRVDVHAQFEDRFSLVMSPQSASKLPSPMYLRTTYRKEVLAALQILHSTATILGSNQLTTLPVRFQGADTNDPRLGFRHPAVKMFDLLPKDHREGRKVFYRRGYMFLLPDHVVDRYELLDNRPCSTYFFNPPDSKTAGASGQLTKNPKKSKHMVARFMPEKAISTDRTESVLEFQLWTESIAYAVAEQEYQEHDKKNVDELAYVDSYFIPERGLYRKKMNVVGDKASWTCFRIHLYTKNREIGIIGVRRMFVPPLLDTLQDMVFVLYGPFKQDRENITEPGFMSELETMVDSLSPAAAALQTRSKHLVPHGTHATYFDRVVLQARSNALFYNRDSYHWLKFHSDLKIVPRTKFIDLECNTLAAIFCKSIMTLFPKVARQGEVEDVDDLEAELEEEKKEEVEATEELDEFETQPNAEVAPVADPLSIIFRMQSQSKDNSDDADDGIAEDWNRRIARYFAFCVDGGWSRAHLTIKKLTQASTLSDANGSQEAQFAMPLEKRKVVDKVMEFLLHIVPEGQTKYVQAPNVVEKLRECMVDEHEIGEEFTFNEWVMVRLLETSYLDTVISKQSDDDGDRANSDIFAYLLKALLTKVYDLDLIRAVCLKIVRLMNRQDSDGMNATELHIPPLIEPLIEHVRNANVYAKTYCVQALIALSINNEGAEMIVRHDTEPVPLFMQVLRKTKSPQLLHAITKLLVSLYPAIAKLYMNENPLIEQSFVEMLVDMLDSRMRTPQRHLPGFLEEISLLLLNLTAEESARDVMLMNDVVGKLMAIVKDHKNYKLQLTTFTKTLANLFIQAKDHPAMFDHDPSDAATMGPKFAKVAENAKDHAITLAYTLSECANKNRIRVCLYILSILRQIIRMDVSDTKYYRKDSKRRFEILHFLASTDIAFDRILTTVVSASKTWLQEKIVPDVAPPSGDDAMLETKEQEKMIKQIQADRKRDATMLREIVDWFKGLIKAASVQKWQLSAFKKEQDARRQRRKQKKFARLDRDDEEKEREGPDDDAISVHSQQH